MINRMSNYQSLTLFFQIQAGLRRRGLNIRAVHIADLLAQAYD
jgi:hypothetical protein